MTDHHNAVQEAATIYRRRGSMDVAARDEAITLLVSHGVWSTSNIQKITDASLWHIRKISKKSDKSGGRINPESLKTLEKILRLKDRGELDRALFVKVIVEEGTSPYMVATLTGYSPTTVKRYAGLIQKEAA